MEINKLRQEGIVHYDPPRAVKIDPKYSYTPDGLHTVVHTSIAVYAETQAQAEWLMLEWHNVMLAASAEAKKILEKVRKNETAGTG